jgi:hypothetical protein
VFSLVSAVCCARGCGLALSSSGAADERVSEKFSAFPFASTAPEIVDFGWGRRHATDVASRSVRTTTAIQQSSQGAQLGRIQR